ncbi:hypothetical protein ACI6QG_11555 [Roseococcus sp. DSY-14]
MFRPPHGARYRVGSGHVTLRPFPVQDPDGTLLRFSEMLDGA